MTNRARLARFAAVGVAAMSLVTLTAGAASAATSPTTDTSAATSLQTTTAACPQGTVPHQTNAVTVPLFRHVGNPLPGGRMERTGDYFGGNFCALWSFTNPQGVEYLSRHDASTWIRASDAHPR